MGTQSLTLVPATAANGLQTEISNALSAKDKIVALIATLGTLRADAKRAFNKTIATDVAALKDSAPGKSFADTEFNKFTTWRTADEEFVKRIDAFGVIVLQLDQYVAEFAASNRDELIAALRAELAELNSELDKEEADETDLRERIHEVCEQLDKLTGKTGPKQGSARPKAKRAPRKGK